jgi:hypothetical protein
MSPRERREREGGRGREREKRRGSRGGHRGLANERYPASVCFIIYIHFPLFALCRFLCLLYLDLYFIDRQGSSTREIPSIEAKKENTFYLKRTHSTCTKEREYILFYLKRKHCACTHAKKEKAFYLKTTHPVCTHDKRKERGHILSQENTFCMHTRKDRESILSKENTFCMHTRRGPTHLRYPG